MRMAAGSLMVLLLFIGCAAIPERQGEIFPAKTYEALQRKLSIPISKEEKKYLGLSHDHSSFVFGDVKAEVLIVEIFNMYCRFCQHSARKVNKLYKLIQEQGYGDRIKIIGIGVQNTPLEVQVFKNKYKTPFPLFSDINGGAKANFNYTQTPYYVAISLIDKQLPKVFYVHAGEFGNENFFLYQIIEASGILEK